MRIKRFYNHSDDKLNPYLSGGQIILFNKLKSKITPIKNILSDLDLEELTIDIIDTIGIIEFERFFDRVVFSDYTIKELSDPTDIRRNVSRLDYQCYNDLFTSKSILNYLKSFENHRYTYYCLSFKLTCMDTLNIDIMKKELSNICQRISNITGLEFSSFLSNDYLNSKTLWIFTQIKN